MGWNLPVRMRRHVALDADQRDPPRFAVIGAVPREAPGAEGPSTGNPMRRHGLRLDVGIFHKHRIKQENVVSASQRENNRE